MDNISLLNILRNDGTNEGNRVGETEGNCLSSPKKCRWENRACYL